MNRWNKVLGEIEDSILHIVGTTILIICIYISYFLIYSVAGYLFPNVATDYPLIEYIELASQSVILFLYLMSIVRTVLSNAKNVMRDVRK